MEEECCSNEITALKEEVEKSVHRVKTLKDEYKNLLIKNLEKDVKIRKLKREIQSTKYNKFERNLSKKCIEILRSIDDTEKEDAKFVSVILNELYDVNILKCKSISGRSKKNDKTALSPEKKLLLDQIYSERLQQSKSLSSIEINTRKKSLTKNIRIAIDVANHKQ